MDSDYIDERTCDIRSKAILCKLDLAIDKIEARLNGMDDALILRASDLERRLEGLNELRAEVVKDRDQFLRQDIYNAKTAGYDAWCTDVNRRLTVIETRSIVWTAAIAIFFVIIQVILHLLKVV